MGFLVLGARSQSTDSWTSAPAPVDEWLAKDQAPGVAGLAAAQSPKDGPESQRVWVVAGEQVLVRPAIAVLP